MIKRIALLGAVAVTAALALAPVSGAGGGNSANAIAGARCVQAGVGTLVSLGLINEAAQGKLNYYPLGSQPGGAGLINIAFSSNPTYIPLKDVIALHRSNPELFDWCDNV
jgi:hypothetical protein